jgi:hypothetical protein
MNLADAPLRTILLNGNNSEAVYERLFGNNLSCNHADVFASSVGTVTPRANTLGAVDQFRPSPNHYTRYLHRPLRCFISVLIGQ